ncbi:MAG: hypothetical protein IKH13_06990, partial [Clostridia bacterium]|nr:hypothetical protein [Clostridia bacterium]
MFIKNLLNKEQASLLRYLLFWQGQKGLTTASASPRILLARGRCFATAPAHRSSLKTVHRTVF